MDIAEPLSSVSAGDRARDELRRTIDEQASLRRLATRVAKGVSDAELFAAVAHEVTVLLDVPAVTVVRYEADLRTETVVAAVGTEGFTVGSQWPVVEPHLGAAVLRNRGPARIDDYGELDGPIADGVRRSAVGSTVGVPIFVGGQLWGLLCVGRKDGRLLPTDTEERLAKFSELISIAISEAQARDSLRAMADAQASLHRVADLVAHGADGQTVFDAVCAETAHLTGSSLATLSRFTPDGCCLILAAWGMRDALFPPGGRYRFGPDTVTGLVHATGEPARIDGYAEASSELGLLSRDRGVHSAVGVPVTVDGQTWGVLQVGSDTDTPLPAGTEHRLAGLTDLAATAISNAAARAALIESRARIVAAGDDARRRIERNLHDGVQQQLVVLGLDLRGLGALIPSEAREAHAALERISARATVLFDEVRRVSRGLHPAVLTHGGLRPALKSLARSSPIPVELSVSVEDRLPDSVEICTYYVVSESLANAAKHAGAQHVTVDVRIVDEMLRAAIEDDGRGGAEFEGGSGLIGLIDRVEALGGRLMLEAPPGAGTRVAIEVPIRRMPPTIHDPSMPA